MQNLPSHQKVPPPLNTLLLQDTTFKQMIRLHNSLKQLDTSQKFRSKFLPMEKIYDILKLYCLARNPASHVGDEELDEKNKVRLRELVYDLIDRNLLTLEQFKYIYLNQKPEA